jgi:hypothetical protein
VAEVGLLDPRGDDQVVVAQRDAIATGSLGDHLLRRDVDVDDVGQHAFDVPVALEDVAQRRRDLALGQDPGGHLVEQRLEQVVLGAVDERDHDVAAAQRPCGEEPAEAAPDDDDAVGRPALPCCLVHGGPLRIRIGQAGSCQSTPFGSSASASLGPHVPR